MPAQIGPFTLAAVAALMLGVNLVAAGEVPAASARQIVIGHSLAERDCGGCHATGRADASRFSGAPPFRDLGRRYPVATLSEALAEGISVGHPAMPERAYPLAEVAALIAYLEDLQPVDGTAEPK